MEPGLYCSRHRTAEASFRCDRCAEPFCQQCRCELLSGDTCCTECAVEAAGETRGEFGSPQGVDYPGVIAATKKRRRGKFLVAVLLICVPLLVVELLFLQRSAAVDVGTETMARRVMGDTLVMVTVLNRYKAEVGQYPEHLEQMVPNHWDPGDTAELESFDYRRIGSRRFTLLPRLTGNGVEDAGIVRALKLIPRSLGEESSLEVFLAPDQGNTNRLTTGDGS